MSRPSRSSKRPKGASAMGASPSQEAESNDAGQSRVQDVDVVPRSKSKKKALAMENSTIHGSASLLLPSSPFSERSSKSKRKRRKKKHQAASDMNPGSTKEEESARTLLEMKGAPANPASESPSAGVLQPSNTAQFRTVNSQSTTVEEPMPFSQGRPHDPEHLPASTESIHGLMKPSHNLSSSQLIDSPPLTPGIRQQSLPTETRDEDDYEPPNSLLDSQMSKDYNRPNYQEASNVPTPPYGSNLDSPVQGSYPTSAPSHAAPREPQDAPRSAQPEKQKKRQSTKTRKEKNPGPTSGPDPTKIVIDPILTGYDRGQEELSVLNHTNSAPPPTSPVYTTKRKRDQVDLTEVDGAGTSPKRSKQSKVQSAKQKTQPGGPFTDEEIALIKDFMERYREEHDITIEALNDRIQETSRTNRDQFWTEVTDVLPYRTKQSIYKVCRRRFHNFGVRGKWTAEEDEELKAAQLEKPNQWKAIGAMVHRMPEDCRDRWRNYLKCGDARNHDVWKADEERALERAVKECKEAMRADREQLRRQGKLAPEDVDDDHEDKLLNWTIISEKMGGVRSRLQCQYKWPKMKKRNEEQMRQSLERQRRIAMGLDPLEEPKRTWRVKRAEGNYTKMLPGDKYELLVSLEEAGAYEEKNIPWKIVGTEGFRKRWSTPDRRTAFRFLKEKVPNSNVLTLEEIITTLKQTIIEEHPNQLNEFYDFSKDNVLLPKKRKRSTHSSNSTDALDDDDRDPTQDSSELSFDGGNDYTSAKNTAVLAQSLLEPHLPHHNHYHGSAQTCANNVDEEMARRVELLQDA